MDQGISGRTAIVTGAAGETGTATTAALLAAGARVVMVDVDQKALDRAVAALPADVETPLTVVSDLADADAARGLATTVADLAGEVDVLVWVPTGPGSPSAFHEVDDESWTASVSTDLIAAVRVTRALLRALRQGGWGRVVYVGPEQAGPPARACHAALTSLADDLSTAYASDGLQAHALPGGPDAAASLVALLAG